ncbi:fatty acid-binding protein-like isoform X2 [Sitophilus oryzae]|uniref:Fatty acid-binding protein-like isoform X2 n=1 Tax=Sitophilus oryzae TaxID=7048 RepID=A0A6J2YF25_SITOR|nr:fatty acid-binding protein-like isoform X2 [Sitophilus oryzae]
MLISGKFQLEKNEHFLEHLVALGIAEEKAKVVDQLRPILEMNIDGDKLTIVSYSGQYKQTSNLVFNEEVDETVASTLTVKSIAQRRDDNKIDIFSRGNNGEKGQRTFEFFEENMIMSLSNDSESIPIAKRYYKRI